MFYNTEIIEYKVLERKYGNALKKLDKLRKPQKEIEIKN